MTSSRIFVSHQSASLYWTSHAKSTDSNSRCAPSPTDKVRKDALQILRNQLLMLDEDDILHLSVCSDKNRHHLTQTRFHYRGTSYPFNSFVPLSKNYLVASPELCFLQAAETLSLFSLILYGFELCGTYARSASNESTLFNRKPLSSLLKIKTYLKASEGAFNIKKARHACKFFIDGSASPRESSLVAILTLPPKYGGFGLPKPSLNHEIYVLDNTLQKRRILFHGDLVWPEPKLVIEYDGSSHGYYNNHALDKQRDHLLLDAGYKVIRFTDKQITNPKEVERLARTINKMGHFRKTNEVLSTSLRKYQTQKTLLFNSDLPWLQ